MTFWDVVMTSFGLPFFIGLMFGIVGMFEFMKHIKPEFKETKQKNKKIKTKNKELKDKNEKLKKEKESLMKDMVEISGFEAYKYQILIKGFKEFFTEYNDCITG